MSTCLTVNLSPFPSEIIDSNLEILVSIDRRQNRPFGVEYLVKNIEDLRIPPTSDRPTRKHELWHETCFEFFLRLPNSPQYWEFNLSPSRDWNVYHFDDYRKGMKEETRFTPPQLLFASIKQEDALILTGQIDLSAIAPLGQVFEMAVSAVTKFQNGDIIYWALTHPEKQADFHHRDSFTITLD